MNSESLTTIIHRGDNILQSIALLTAVCPQLKAHLSEPTAQNPADYQVKNLYYEALQLAPLKLLWLAAADVFSDRMQRQPSTYPVGTVRWVGDQIETGPAELRLLQTAFAALTKEANGALLRGWDPRTQPLADWLKFAVEWVLFLPWPEDLTPNPTPAPSARILPFPTPRTAEIIPFPTTSHHEQAS